MKIVVLLTIISNDFSEILSQFPVNYVVTLLCAGTETGQKTSFKGLLFYVKC